jgi:hypothetical protein
MNCIIDETQTIMMDEDIEANHTVIQFMETLTCENEEDDEDTEIPLFYGVYKTKMHGKYMVVYNIHQQEEALLWLEENFLNLYQSATNFHHITDHETDFKTPSFQQKANIRNSQYAKGLQ